MELFETLHNSFFHDPRTIPSVSTSTVSFLSNEIPKKVFGGFDNFFHVYLMRGFQKYERN